MTDAELPFDLIEIIGRGSMGIVWRARSHETGGTVAIKMLHPHLLDDASSIARFEREVELMRRVQSRFTVQTLGFGRSDGKPYIVMEYVEPPTLRAVLHDEGPMPWREASRILLQVTHGLAAIHAQGIIHRDVKPSNILLPRGRDVKLADFGVARASDVTRLTATAATIGTVAYMAPESTVSPRSDFYALGCVAYEMLTGVPPFEGDSYHQVFMRHLQQQPDLARVPAETRLLLRWLLEKDPNRRPQSAGEIVAALQGGPIPERAPELPPIRQQATAPPVIFAPPRNHGDLRVVAGVWSLVVLAGIIALVLVVAWERGGEELQVGTFPVGRTQTSDVYQLEIVSIEVTPAHRLRVHERITDVGPERIGWAFNQDGGIYVVNDLGAKFVPTLWSVDGRAARTDHEAAAAIEPGASQDMWVEFAGFPHMSGTFTFHDTPFEFTGLSAAGNQ